MDWILSRRTSISSTHFVIYVLLSTYNVQMQSCARSTPVIKICSELSADDIRQEIELHYNQGLIIEMECSNGKPFDACQLSALLSNNSVVCPTCPGLTIQSANHQNPLFDCKASPYCRSHVVASGQQPLVELSSVGFRGCQLSLEGQGEIEFSNNSFDDGTLLFRDCRSPVVQRLRMYNATLQLSLTRNTAAVQVNGISLDNAAVEVEGEAFYHEIYIANISLNGSTELPRLQRAAVTLRSSFASLSVENCTFFNNTVRPMILYPGDGVVTVNMEATLKNCLFSDNNVSSNTSNSDEIFSAGLSALLSNSISLTLTDCSYKNNRLVTGDTPNNASGAGLQIAFNGMHSAVALEKCSFTGNLLAMHSSKSKPVIPSPWQHGGGAAFLFHQTAENNSLLLVDCTISDNSALQGGGIAVEFWGASSNNVTIHGSNPPTSQSGTCEFIGNSATEFPEDNSRAHKGNDFNGLGGGLLVKFHESDGSHFIRGNHVVISNCLFVRNCAAGGGGIFSSFHQRDLKHSVNMSNCLFDSNTAISGAALSLWSSFSSWSQEEIKRPGINLTNIGISNNRAYFRGALAATAVQMQTHGLITFFNNTNTALSLRKAIVHVHSQMVFTHNYGFVGAGLFSSASRTVFYPHSSFQFSMNVAIWVGGGIYADNEARSVEAVSSPYNPFCFIGPANEEESTPSWMKMINFNFHHNAAGESGSAIYVSDLLPCIWTMNQKNFHIREWLKITDGNVVLPALKQDNIIAAVPGGSATLRTLYSGKEAWNNEWLPTRTSNITADILKTAKEAPTNESTLATDITTLLFFTRSDQNKRNNMMTCEEALNLSKVEVTVEARPGMGELQLSAIACDQMLNKRDAVLSLTVHPNATKNSDEMDKLSCNPPLVVTNGRLAHLNSATHLTERITIAGCGKYATDEPTAMVLATLVGTSREVSNKFRIRLKPCWPGYAHQRSQEGVITCHCRDSFHPGNHVKRCNGSKITLKAGYWATDIGEGKLAFARCPPGHCKGEEPKEVWVYDSEHPEKQCRYERNGLLCGSCPNEKALSLDIFSGRCFDQSECKLKWEGSVILTVVVSFVVSLFVLWMDLPISNDIRGLLFFSSTIRMIFDQNDRFVRSSQAGGSNFEKFVAGALSIATFNWPSNNCYFPVKSAVESIAMGYIVPASILCGIVIWHICFYIFNSSVSPFHGTCLLLFYVFCHLLETSFLLLSFTEIETYGKRFLWNADVEFFKGEYLYLFCIAGIVAIVLSLGPLICLFVAFCKYVKRKYRARRQKLKSEDVDIRGYQSIMQPSQGNQQEAPQLNPSSNTPCHDGSESAPLLSTRKRFSWFYMEEVIKNLLHILAVGLEDNLTWFWSWDLFRRVVIFAINFSSSFTCDDYPTWLPQHINILALVLFLTVHILGWPYRNAKRDEEDSIVYWSMLFFKVKKDGVGWMCNYFEAGVLGLMIVIGVVSKNNDDDYSLGDARVVFISVLITILLTIYFIFVVYKILFIFCYRICTCSCCKCERCHHKPGSSVPTIHDNETETCTLYPTEGESHC